MRVIMIGLATSALSASISACTTVDMTSMGGTDAAPARAASAPNVVEKATSKLFALFSSRGWSTHDSRKRMRSAAETLLGGLDRKGLGHMPSDYVERVEGLDALARDVREAHDHVDQTVRAAEIFLAMSDTNELREELADLEQALLASRQAQSLFRGAATVHGEPDALSLLEARVDKLRDVTDEFGRRVRRARTRDVARVSGDISGS